MNKSSELGIAVKKQEQKTKFTRTERKNISPVYFFFQNSWIARRFCTKRQFVDLLKPLLLNLKNVSGIQWMTGDRGFSFSGQLVTEPSLWLCQLCGILCYLALGQWTILILLRENLKHTYLSRHIFLRFNFF